MLLCDRGAFTCLHLVTHSLAGNFSLILYGTVHHLSDTAFEAVRGEAAGQAAVDRGTAEAVADGSAQRRFSSLHFLLFLMRKSSALSMLAPFLALMGMTTQGLSTT